MRWPTAALVTLRNACTMASFSSGVVGSGVDEVEAGDAMVEPEAARRTADRR